MKVAQRALYFPLFRRARDPRLRWRSVGSPQPSIAPLLVRAVLAASIAGLPGLIHRRAWPAIVVLLSLGAYLLFRTVVPLPPEVHGAAAQYHFYIDALWRGGVT